MTDRMISEPEASARGLTADAEMFAEGSDVRMRHHAAGVWWVPTALLPERVPCCWSGGMPVNP